MKIPKMLKPSFRGFSIRLSPKSCKTTKGAIFISLIIWAQIFVSVTADLLVVYKIFLVSITRIVRYDILNLKNEMQILYNERKQS